MMALPGLISVSVRLWMICVTIGKIGMPSTKNMQGREWKDSNKGTYLEGSKLDRGEFAEESQRYPLSKRIPAYSSGKY